MLLKILLGLTCVFFLSGQAVAQGEMKSVLEELERRIDRGRAVVGDCVTGDCGGQAAEDGGGIVSSRLAVGEPAQCSLDDGTSLQQAIRTGVFRASKGDCSMFIELQYVK